MKRLLLIISAILLLTGCTAGETPAEDPEQPVSLRVWVGDQADLPWINEVISGFTRAHPEKIYRIDVGVQNEGDAAKAVLTDVEAAADVFTFADDQLSLLMTGGALMPIQDGAESIRMQNLAEAAAAASDPSGQLYAYPATADNGYFLFYNTQYFSDEDVQTLEGILDKAAAAGKYFAYPMSNGWYLYSFFKAAGLEMELSEDGVTNRCTWNAADAEIPGTSVLARLMEIGAHPGFIEADSDAFVAGVKDGSIIAGVSGTWNASVAADIWGSHYAAAKLPTFQLEGQPRQMASFSGFKLVGVNAYSAHVGDAMDLAAFMTARDAQIRRFELRRQGPSNLEALASPAVMEEPAIAAITAQAPFASIQRVGSKYWDAAAALGKIIVNGNPNGVPLQTLLDQCVQGITAPADQ